MPRRLQRLNYCSFINLFLTKIEKKSHIFTQYDFNHKKHKTTKMTFYEKIVSFTRKAKHHFYLLYPFLVVYAKDIHNS